MKAKKTIQGRCLALLKSGKRSGSNALQQENICAEGMQGAQRLAATQITVLILLAAGCLATVDVRAQTHPEPPVGEVGFVIGHVKVVSHNGESRTVTSGDPVYAGDQINTQSGQHVHVRFSDNGFVSVRPDSRLIIERYEVGADQPEIRLTVVNGTVRTITGDTARERKDRFRLNTPIAAIGIRGTDFIVKATADSLKAVVNSGEILVSPLGNGCTASGTGPCETHNTVALSDSMGQVLLELSPRQTPRITPLPPLPANPDGVHHEPPLERDVIDALGRTNPSNADRKLLANQDSLNRQNTHGAPASTPQPVSPPQLMWGRWAEPAYPDDTVTTTYDNARTGRTITVGNLYAGLFRTESANTSKPDIIGKTGFNLISGQVHLHAPGAAPSPGLINGGTLIIDFSRNTFSTDLALSHISTGQHNLQANGIIRDDGMFASVTDTSRVAGAVSHEGREAGYLFQKQVTGGVLSGVTLWGR